MKPDDEGGPGVYAFVALITVALGITLGSVTWSVWAYGVPDVRHGNWRCGFEMCDTLPEPLVGGRLLGARTR